MIAEPHQTKRCQQKKTISTIERQQTSHLRASRDSSTVRRQGVKEIHLNDFPSPRYQTSLCHTHKQDTRSNIGYHGSQTVMTNDNNPTECS